MKLHLLFCFVGVVSFVSVVDSIYEDQIGEFDYFQQRLGLIKFLQYPINSSKYFYCASNDEHQTVAKVNAKTGDIKWRNVLAADDVIDKILLIDEVGLMSLSSNGKKARMWSGNDGSLIWDQEVYVMSEKESDNSVTMVKRMDQQSIAILSNNQVYVVSVASGRIIWKWRSEDNDIIIKSIYSFQENQQAFILAQHIDKTLILKRDKDSFSLLQSFTGSVDRSHIVMNENHVSTFISISSDGKGLHLKSLEEGGEKNFELLSKLKINEQIIKIETKMESCIVLHLSSGVEAAFRILSNLKTQVIGTIDNGVIGEYQSFMGPRYVSLTSILKDKSISTELYNAKSGELENKISSDYSINEHGKLLYGYPIIIDKVSDSIMFQLLLISQDYAMNFYGNNESKHALWIREESLAYIQQADWVLPMEIGKVGIPQIPTFMDSFTLELKKIKKILKADSLNTLLDDARYSNDYFFGFKKYFIALSKSGKLIALDSKSGKIQWSRLLNTSSYKMIITRDQPGLGVGPELLLYSINTLNQVHMIWIEADTGNEIKEERIKNEQKHLFLLPRHKNHLGEESLSLNHRIIAFIDPSFNLNLIPNNSESYDELKHVFKNLYITMFNEKENTIQGYRVSLDLKRINPVWSIAIPFDETIVAQSNVLRKEIIASTVVITGDDSLLLKYLNQHVVSFITIKDTLDHEGTKKLQLYIIDTVSGRILHRVSHNDCMAPVSLVQTENWIVYSYWNHKLKRTEMTSVALYEGAIATKGLSLWKRPYYPTETSSFSSKLPIVLQKSFLFPTKIYTMAPTLTAQGITPKHLMIGMGTGQVFLLARKLIDPRRPEVKPNAAQIKEGLIQYFPILPIYNNLFRMTSYNQSIQDLSSISCTSSSLESTSICMTYGLDLFYARVAPVKSFDLLPSDFNFELLVLLTTGLGVLTLVMRSLVARKILNDAWK